MHVERVVETCLYVEDVEVAARWYEAVLGLERVSDEHPRHVFLAAGDSMLLLFNADEAEKPADAPAHGARGVQHVALGVDDVEPWRARLAEHGVEVETEVSFGSGRSLYFRDPDANVVELVSRGTWPVW